MKEITPKEYIETFHRNKSRLAKVYEKLSFDAANGNVRSYFKELDKNTCNKLREAGYTVGRYQDLSSGMWFSIVYCSDLVDAEPREITVEERHHQHIVDFMKREHEITVELLKEKEKEMEQQGLLDGLDGIERQSKVLESFANDYPI